MVKITVNTCYRSLLAPAFLIIMATGALGIGGSQAKGQEAKEQGSEPPRATQETAKDAPSPKTESVPLSAEEQKKLDELKEEREIGRNMAGRLLGFYDIYEDDQLLGYINQVGSYVGSFGDDPERRYMFEIIKSDMVNAFAAPGGYIVITVGALRHARDEAELAAVLAHETVHVSKKHVYNTLRSMSKEDVEKAAKESEHRPLDPELQVRKRPDPEDSFAGALLARYLSGATAGLNLLAAAKAGMSVLLERGLKPELEYEADADGVRNAIRAGYYPLALSGYLCRIQQKKMGKQGKCVIEREWITAKKDKKTILEKTHPPIPERIEHIQKMLDAMQADQIVGAKGKKRFQHYTSKIPAVNPPKGEKEQEKEKAKTAAS